MRTEFQNFKSCRWYTISIISDLFGAVILMKSWGGIGKAMSGLDQEVYSTIEDAMIEYHATKKLRISHGYEVTFSNLALEAA